MANIDEPMTDGLGDWRILGALRLANDMPAAYPGGPTHKAGTPIYVVTTTVNTPKKPMGFITPSAAALALDLAIHASNKSLPLRTKLRFKDVITPEGPGTSLVDEDTATFFEYLQLCMMAVTFSYQALEAFANYEIANRLKILMSIKRKDDYELMTAANIERNLSTEDKYHQVLPVLLDVYSPKGTKVWDHLKVLKKARDSVTHIKAVDQYPNGLNRPVVDQDSLFYIFLNTQATIFPKYAIELIHYMLSKHTNLPRWLLKPIEFTKGL